MTSPPRTAIAGPIQYGLINFRLVTNVIIPVQYFYTLTFNYIPDNIRLAMAGGIAVVFTLLSMWAAISRPGGWSVLILISAFITVLCWGLNYTMGSNVFNLKIVSRDILPFITVIWILSYPEAMRHRLLCFLAVASIIIGSALAFIGDPVTLGGITRLAAFTGIGSVGGTYGLHASSYFIMLNVFMIDQLRQWRAIRPGLAWAVIGLGVTVLLMYQVRTTIVMLVVYVLSVYYFKYTHIRNVRRYTFIAASIAAVFVFGYFGMTGLEVSGELGSGRIAAYAHRLNLLASRDFLPFMFGSGPGSDNFTIEIWYWAAKDSHNDFLHVFVERGLLGFAGLIIFLVALYRRLTGSSKALLISLIAGSAISNGLFSRPSQIVYLFFAMGLAYCLHSDHLTGRRPVSHLTPKIPDKNQ